MNFSQIVLRSKEFWLRRDRAAKRRDTMDTPKKKSRILSSKQSLQGDKPETPLLAQRQEPFSTKDEIIKKRLQMRRSISSKNTVPNDCKEEMQRNTWDVGD